MVDTAPVCSLCTMPRQAQIPTPTSMMELCFFCDVAPSSSTAGLQEVPATEAATVICSVLLLEPDEVVGYTTMGRPPMMDALHNKIQQDTTRYNKSDIHVSTYTAVSALPRGTAHSARVVNFGTHLAYWPQPVSYLHIMLPTSSREALHMMGQGV